jgi:hypothetical protein
MEPAERALLEAHLAGCPECRRLVDEYAEVVAKLPQALAASSPLQPPAALRDRVWHALQGATQAGAVRPVGPNGHTGTVRLAVPITRRPAWLNLRTAAAAVCVVLLLVAIGWALQLNIALAQERALRAEYANLVGQQEIVLEVIDSNKTVKALLKAQESGSTAYGKLYTRPDLPNVVVMAARLPPPAAGQSYRLWLSSDNHSESPGSLAINSQGFGIIVFDAGRIGPVYQKAQLLLQPDTVTTSSGTVILTWEAGR